MMKQKGITLIALVMTIVVMLVLVGVTITTVINSDLIGKAKETGAQTKEMSEAEPEQADDLLNSAIGLVDNDIEILREFFGKGPYVVGWVGNYLNENIEPIPDARTSIEFLGTCEVGDYFAYNGKIYFVEIGDNSYGDVILKSYSDQFTTIALQGSVVGLGNSGTMIEYDGPTYCLNFDTGSITRYWLRVDNYYADYYVELLDYDGSRYDILNSYNPRLWIEGEEVTVTLVQIDEIYVINVPSAYVGKEYRATLTINGEFVESTGTISSPK